MIQVVKERQCVRLGPACRAGGRNNDAQMLAAAPPDVADSTATHIEGVIS